MASLTLKEIGASDPEDQPVLELFASFREHVVHVAASHLLPDQIAVTTKNGFVELIHTSNGEFRLFLTHLDRIPLDASLRCFSLVPSLYAASARHHSHLLYSLAYSNELLVADVETGAVRVLAACASRPSVVRCDGDYIVCGEGNGQVSVWRGSAEVRDWGRSAQGTTGSLTFPPLLWRRPLCEDAVACLGIYRDQLICCAADYSCVVASVEDGAVRTTISLDLDGAVAAFPLTVPALGAEYKVMAVCLTSRICVYTGQSSERDADSSRKGVAVLPSSKSRESQERWSHVGGCCVGAEEVACASCHGSYLAAGTSSGLVLLYSCDAAVPEVRELVRFNVGYGVKGIQLYGNASLLVVTSAGDVWRWPLSDLLNTTVESREAEGDGAGEDEPEPATEQPPAPAAAPKTAATAPAQEQLNETLPPSALVPTSPFDESYTQEGELEERNISDQEDLSAEPHAPLQEEQKVNMGGSGRSGDRTPPAEPPIATVGITSVHLSSSSSSSSAVVEGVDVSKEGSISGHEHMGGAFTRDGSVDLNTQPAEPATTLCLSTPPLEPRVCETPSSREAKKATTVRKSPSPPKAVLFDTETASSLPLPTPKSYDAPVEAVRAREVSFEDAPDTVSPPTSADTTTTAPEDTSPTKLPDTLNADENNTEALARSPGSTGAAVELPILAPADPVKPPLCTHAKDAAPSVRPSSVPRASKDPTTETEKMAQLEAEFDQAMARLIGPEKTIEGLRRGRRMDPRKVEGVLTNLASQRANARAMEKLPRALTGLNSTKLLEQQRTALEAQGFDFDAYRREHKLEVDALQYRHRVKAPTYALQDRVFDDVVAASSPERIGGSEEATPAARHLEQKAEGSVPLILAGADELRDATYSRVKRTIDPKIAEERRRGGPSLAQHRCDDLLFPKASPSSTVFFKEEALLPSTAWEEVFLWPMPLPPTSSVF